MTGFWFSDFLLLVAAIFGWMLFWQLWPVWLLVGIAWLVGEHPWVGWPVLGLALLAYNLSWFRVKW